MDLILAIELAALNRAANRLEDEQIIGRVLRAPAADVDP
jgi:hypothetical protein